MNALCRIGLHRWRRRALPLEEWQGDMLNRGYPVRRTWAHVCRRGCGEER